MLGASFRVVHRGKAAIAHRVPISAFLLKNNRCLQQRLGGMSASKGRRSAAAAPAESGSSSAAKARSRTPTPGRRITVSIYDLIRFGPQDIDPFGNAKPVTRHWEVILRPNNDQIVQLMNLAPHLFVKPPSAPKVNVTELGMALQGKIDGRVRTLDEGLDVARKWLCATFWGCRQWLKHCRDSKLSHADYGYGGRVQLKSAGGREL